MKKVLFGAIFLMAAQTAWAMDEMSHQHHMMGNMEHVEHGDHQHMVADEPAQKDGVYMVKKEVDGYSVTFHVMLAGGMYHGGSHNLMIRIEQGGKDAEITAINSKVFFPDGESESKMLIKMGEWYMNGYDLEGSSQHGLMVLFKTADGKKHKASAYYPEP